MLVRGTLVRHCYTTGWGLIITYYMYGEEIGSIFLLAGVSYFLMVYAPKKHQHFLVSAWNAGFIFYNQVREYFFNHGNYSFGITAVTLLLVLRLTSVAWCYRDSMTDPAMLSDRQKKMATTRGLPSVLEFTSYVFTHQSACLAIFFEYTDYIHFIEFSHEYE